MSPNEILRLAGVNAEITIAPTPIKEDSDANVHSAVKFALVNAIEHYNHESEKNSSPNVKQIYSELVGQLDRILGFVISNQNPEACKLFAELDGKSKRLVVDEDHCVAKYFNCEEKAEPAETEAKPKEPEQTAAEPKETEKPEVKKPAEDASEDKKSDEKKSDEKEAEDKESKKVNESNIDLPSMLDEPTEPKAEKDAAIKVPANVIADIKLQIKELDDGLNHEYTSHLSGYDTIHAKYCNIKCSLNQLLDYLTDADQTSLTYATTFLTALDSTTKQHVPASVWKYLSVNYAQSISIKDRFSVLKKVNYGSN